VLQSRIILLRFRVKILILILTPILLHANTKATFLKQTKLNIKVRSIFFKRRERQKHVLFVTFLIIHLYYNIRFEAGAASRCGFDSKQIIWLLAAPASLINTEKADNVE
jgi:hypothetical protein